VCAGWGDIARGLPVALPVSTGLPGSRRRAAPCMNYDWCDCDLSTSKQNVEASQWLACQWGRFHKTERPVPKLCIYTRKSLNFSSLPPKKITFFGSCLQLSFCGTQAVAASRYLFSGMRWMSRFVVAQGSGESALPLKTCHPIKNLGLNFNTKYLVVQTLLSPAS
jgi:hypothetical protein